jgi:hypothetical protein
MKVLFITHPKEDYLQDQIIIGLKRTDGVTCIEYPRKDILYSDCDIPDTKLYGNGFTIWKNLDPSKKKESPNFESVISDKYDVVIFGSIWRQVKIFKKIRRKGILNNDETKVAFIDGEDIPPSRTDIIVDVLKGNRKTTDMFAQKVYRHGNEVFLPALDYGSYFKRELRGEISSPTSKYPVLPISFSIPSEKVSDITPKKEKSFPRHVQLDEAYSIKRIEENSTKKKIFDNESQYYEDLRLSKFGITQKKGGWECMRHYEIAANGCIPCFYKLRQKPFLSAPHGLSDMHNCISFDSAEELRQKTDYVDERSLYKIIAKNSLKWAEFNTCKRRAQTIIACLT